MANIKVLTKASSDAGNCGCSGEGGSGGGSGQSQNPADSILVRHKPGTVTGNAIAAFNENGKKVYELQDLALVSPIINLSNDAPVPVEVGRILESVIFNGSIAQGTFPISNRNITPDPGGLDLTAPITFTIHSIKRTTPGDIALYTLSALDNQGNLGAKSSKVVFKHAFYQGLNSLATLNQTQIKALAKKNLLDSILDLYGGVKSYTIGGSVAQYIYWAGPVGTPIIGGASLNGFALPLVDVGPIAVTNIFDGTLQISYWVKRTVFKIDPGTYQIGLS